MPIIRRRSSTNNADLNLAVHPLLQRIYLARGVKHPHEVDLELKNLLSYENLLGIDPAVNLLYEALQTQQHIMIIGDYDADGATSTALAVRALRAFGATKVSYLVPNRFEYGYGLTPEIVALAAQEQPNLLITVDNGIASIAGVEAANALNIQVLITDHHLPAATLPNAAAIVNPNQAGCTFASKAIAGVGVCFYVMSALRHALQQKNWFTDRNIPVPNMAHFLDLVALGTVADVVPLDHNNRILVQHGLKRIRAGKCVPGITALLEVAKRTEATLAATDLGFVVGPRLNAAGRLDDMSLGIECLITDDLNQARSYAQELNNLNLDRRDIEQDMKQQAFANLKKLQLNKEKLPFGLCLYDPSWHQGVIGILAGRIKDEYHRPVIAFAQTEQGELKGSARSVVGVHIRDVLDAIATQHPELISKFGGHAMAAGLSIAEHNFKKFSENFDQEVRKYLQAEALRGEILTDGPLEYVDFNLALVELLQDAGPWGQAFPEPIFEGEFIIIEQRIVGQRHLRLALQHPDGERIFSAIKFNVDLKLWPNYRCQKIYALYKLDINEFNNVRNIQLLIEHLEARNK